MEDDFWLMSDDFCFGFLGFMIYFKRDCYFLHLFPVKYGATNEASDDSDL